ncbi:MAG: 16S rRNA (guanine(966)-N(2))-methyltransferase RsmD, partial [Christensenellaceae bacterium]
GKYRGRTLVPFEGKDVRPTADRVKESLFAILQDKIVGARVLDLFCGSGNLGIECLSRGAKEVHFNDVSPASIRILQKNLAFLKGERTLVTCRDYLACLAAAAPYDLIFIDPPYREDFGMIALDEIGRRGLLKAGGVAVYESDRPTREIEGLTLCDTRSYGRTKLYFYT